MILRETAVMGLLGVATLGFFLDSALVELRLDRALILVLATALLTLAIDALSRALRSRFGPSRLEGCHHENRSLTTENDAYVATPSL